MKTSLTIYRNACKSYDHAAQLFQSNGVPFKTLWVPFDSGNRTAAINLNHAMGSFIGCDILIGANGNCGTRYAILPIPAHWTEDGEVTDLANALCARLGKSSGYRVLKADARLRSIIEGIVEMAGAEWSSEIYGDVAAIDLVSGEEKLEALKPVNQQMVREVMRMDEATGIAYVTKADAKKLAKALHRYPKGHNFAKQVIGVSLWTARLYRSNGKVVLSNFNAPVKRTIEVASIDYYDVLNGDKKVIVLIGEPAKAVAELDRTLAAEDAQMLARVEQTYMRGIQVSRPGQEAVVVHSREEIIDLLPKWGLAWNAPSQHYMDNFLSSPEESCKLLLPNSGPVPTILARL
jgi:hypothetical protein